MRKKKELFCNFVQFTIIFFCERKGKLQQPQQRKQAVRPKIPERTKQRGERDKAGRCAERNGKKCVKPQLAVADAQCEGKQKDEERERIEQIQYSSQITMCTAAQPQSAQRIVKQR